MKIKTAYTDSKRLFIAITLPEDLRFLLFESIKNLAEKDFAIRPVLPEYIHLTLKFLGSTNISMLNEIEGAISDTTEVFECFSFSVGNKIAAFPPEMLSPGFYLFLQKMLKEKFQTFLTLLRPILQK